MSFWKQNSTDIIKITIAVIAVIVAIFAKSFYDDKGHQYVIFTTCIGIVVLLVYFFNLYIIYSLQSKFMITKIDNVVNDYKSAMELKEVEWYYTMKALINFEFNQYPTDRNNKEKEIWVISKYLEHDDTQAHLNAEIKKNITVNHVKYRYIVPNVADQGLKEKSERIFRFFVKELKKENPFTFLKEDAFDYPCDLLIFNPSFTHSHEIIVFMELRVSRDAKERKWAKIENSSAKRIFESIKRDISDTKNLIKIENSILKHLVK